MNKMAKSFKCDKCGNMVEWVERCQSFVCSNWQCGKHFWSEKSERELCKHCGYSKTFPCDCGGTFFFSTHCGAYVCDRCDKHKTHEKGQTLARCFCGYGLRAGERLEEY